MSLGDVGMQEDIQREMERSAALAHTIEKTIPYITVGTRPYGITKVWLKELISSSNPVSENVIRALVHNVKFATSVNDVWLDESKLPKPKGYVTKSEEVEPINIDPNLVSNFYINAKVVRASAYSLTLEVEGGGGEVFLEMSKHGNKLVNYWNFGGGLLPDTTQTCTLNELMKTYKINLMKINPRNATVHGFIVEPLQLARGTSE